jgi:hypothetical protein
MQNMWKILYVLLLWLPVHGGTLYYTEFEEFPAGDNRWAGTGGWVSNDTTSGAQGIIPNAVRDLPIGNAAYIGYSRPASRFTTVFRTMNHDPVATGLPIIRFESLLGVQDSTNGRRDRFHISFYNIGGNFLAGITFDNTTGVVRRDDGLTVTTTGIPFLRGDTLLGLAALQILNVEIDLPNNVWSAELDGIPLFRNVTFNASGRVRTLGPVAAEWAVASEFTAAAGDNWLLVADWLVAALPREPFRILSFTRFGGGQSTISWPGHTGFDYQLFYSADLVNWKSDLPNSSFIKVAGDGVISLTDGTSPAPGSRFYRVLRSPSR